MVTSCAHNSNGLRTTDYGLGLRITDYGLRIEFEIWNWFWALPFRFCDFMPKESFGFVVHRKVVALFFFSLFQLVVHFRFVQLPLAPVRVRVRVCVFVCVCLYSCSCYHFFFFFFGVSLAAHERNILLSCPNWIWRLLAAGKCAKSEPLVVQLNMLDWAIPCNQIFAIRYLSFRANGKSYRYIQNNRMHFATFQNRSLINLNINVICYRVYMIKYWKTFLLTVRYSVPHA